MSQVRHKVLPIASPVRCPVQIDMRGLQADPIDGDLPAKKRDQLGPDVQGLPGDQWGSGEARRAVELRRARAHPEPGIPGQCQSTAYLERASGEIADDRLNIPLVVIR